MMDLTVAICMYNAEKYIGEALESVLNQTVRGFKLLIIDDCSTDGSVEKVKALCNQLQNAWELVQLEENGGICHARHFAELHATTRYMMFLDADDILVPDSIEKMYHKITSDPDLMAVGCYLDYIDGKGKKIGGGLFLGDTTKEAFCLRAMKGKLIFMQPTAIYDRELALSVGGYDVNLNPNLNPDRIRWQDYCEDLDLWTRMSDLYKEGKAIVVVPEVLCHYRKINSGMSANTFRMSVKMKYVKNNVRRRRRGEENITFAEFYNSLTPAEIASLKRDAEAADALRNGVFYLKDHHFLKGLGLVSKAMVLRPGYIVDKVKHNVLRMK